MKKEVGPYLFDGTLMVAVVFSLFVRRLNAYTALQGMRIIHVLI